MGISYSENFSDPKTGNSFASYPIRIQFKKEKIQKIENNGVKEILFNHKGRESTANIKLPK